MTRGAPLRVCLVSAAYRPYLSGVSEHVHDLARHLRLQGHEVSILTTRYQSDGAEADPPGVTRLGRALVLPFGAGHFTLPVGLRLSGQVRDFIQKGGFDIVHCHGIFPPEIAYWAAVHARAPVVATFHSIAFNPGRWFRELFRRLFSELQSRIAIRIAVSQVCRDWTQLWFPGDCRVVFNGVDTEKFQPGAPAPDVLRGSGPTILFVGRLDRRKGLPVLLNAMPAILRGFPDVRLVVVGPGPLESHCRQLCRRLGISSAVHFEGPVASDRLPGYYGNCTVYASPAVGRESMGIVLVEAMACGRAIVASDIAGYNEVVQPDLSGLLVPQNEPMALAAAVMRVLADPGLRSRLERGALERVRDFAWPLVAAQIESTYHEACA